MLSGDLLLHSGFALLLAALAAIVIRGLVRKARLKGETDAARRLASYRGTIVALWALAGLCAAAWFGAGRGAAEFGLAHEASWRLWASWGAVGLIVAQLVYGVFSAAK